MIHPAYIASRPNVHSYWLQSCYFINIYVLLGGKEDFGPRAHILMFAIHISMLTRSRIHNA